MLFYFDRGDTVSVNGENKKGFVRNEGSSCNYISFFEISKTGKGVCFTKHCVPSKIILIEKCYYNNMTLEKKM